MRQAEAEAIVASLAKAVIPGPQPLAPGLTQENFDGIEAGMSRAEVEALLGKPSFCLRSGVIDLPPSGVFPVTHPDWGVWHWFDHGGTGRWHVETHAASVSFDTSGKATRKNSEIFLVREPFSLPSLLWRAEREWRRWFVE
jgi:hypothetical protein